MALTTTVIGLSFVFEHEDLLFLALFEYFASNLSTFNNRRTNFNIPVIYNCQYLIEYYFGINIVSEFFNKDFVAFLNTILFSARFDNSVHSDTSSSIYSLNTAPCGLKCLFMRLIFIATCACYDFYIISYQTRPVKEKISKKAGSK